MPLWLKKTIGKSLLGAMSRYSHSTGSASSVVSASYKAFYVVQDGS